MERNVLKSKSPDDCPLVENLVTDHPTQPEKVIKVSWQSIRSSLEGNKNAKEETRQLEKFKPRPRR